MGTHYTLADLLRRFALNGEKPSKELMAETGLDIEILEQIWDIIRARINNMRGSCSLDDHFDVDNSMPFREWYAESGLAGKYQQVYRVANLAIDKEIDGTITSLWPLTGDELNRYRVEHGQRQTRLRIFVTRRGQWIVWTNWPTSSFSIFTNPRDAIKAAVSLFPNEHTQWFTAVKNSWVVHSVALEAAETLCDLYKLSIEKRRSELRDETADHAKTDAILAHIKR